MTSTVDFCWFFLSLSFKDLQNTFFQLEFQPDLLITHMYSAEDECVELTPTVRPLGGVESWLVLVESSMKNTIRVIFGDSMTDMPKKTRKEWVLEWPGQIVIAGCQTYWTAEVEAAILKKDLPGFFEVLLDNVSFLQIDNFKFLILLFCSWTSFEV